MVRTKKPEDKPREGATLSIDVDSFVRTRDSVVTGLATLQDAIQTLSSAYIKHTNAVLGEHGAGMDVDSALSRLGDNPLLGGLSGLRAASPAKSAAGDAKVAKKKRAHDPNAPKRPLTPYFLYMKTARPIIAEDLGPDVAKGAVSSEGVRRWNLMAVGDKQLWAGHYTDNLKLYNARVHSYKGGNQNAKDMTDEEAAAYAETHNIGIGPIEPTADGQLTSEALLDLPSSALGGAADPDAPGEDDDDAHALAAALAKETSLAPKTPKTKSSGRNRPKGKAGAAASASNTVTPAVIVPPSAIVPPSKAKEVEAEKEKSPDKKRKRTSKAAGKGKEAVEEVVASVEEAIVETPKTTEKEKKPRKKKSKGDS